QIDFASAKEYPLKKDIVLPENYSVEKVNCQIKGEGHKLIFGKGATFGEFNGKLSDLTIESSGDAVFTTVSETALIQNITVNVNAEVISKNVTSLFALTNYGTIDGVTLNVGGKMNVLAEIAEGADDGAEFVFGGLVQSNSYKVNTQTQTVYNGVVQNCKVNYTNFQLGGEVKANAMFGGVVGINSAYLLECSVTGEIVADTFDVAGVCSINSGILSGSVNAANLSQTSSNTNWNPIVSGIVSRNYYVVQNCENKGSISSVSTCEQSKEGQVTAAGIVYLNGIDGVIERSKNSGAVTAKGSAKAYAGGIAAMVYARISNCLSDSEITVTAKNVFAGGILASSEVTPYGATIYFGVAENCISQDRISVTVIGDAPAFVGGIAGRVYEYEVNPKLYVGGGVTNSNFTGECLSEVSYFGGIVGVCGAYIHENNSYYGTDGKEYHNFKDNYYSYNAFYAFGATVTAEEEYAIVTDKGASCVSLQEIHDSKEYQAILSIFKN
ncbi:MAG: hypothetical protein K2N74_00065, partial [Clostridiales bacterium]|nr:hypothetical protein [Clostridiales bacterium]